jgi:hypothetical protein
MVELQGNWKGLIYREATHRPQHENMVDLSRGWSEKQAKRQVKVGKKIDNKACEERD